MYNMYNLEYIMVVGIEARVLYLGINSLPLLKSPLLFTPFCLFVSDRISLSYTNWTWNNCVYQIELKSVILLHQQPK